MYENKVFKKILVKKKDCRLYGDINNRNDVFMAYYNQKFAN